MPEPAEQFDYAYPARGEPANEIRQREHHEALARLFYTTNVNNPQSPREGQPRINAADPTNVKLEFYISGAWRTGIEFLQNPTGTRQKLIFEQPVTTPLTAWTIDHNFSTKPLVQIFDASFNLLQPKSPSLKPEILTMPPIDLTAFAPGGPIPVVAAFPINFPGRITNVFAALHTAGSSPGGASQTVDMAINGTPITGGSVTLSGAIPGGTVVPGAPVTAANIFAAGDTLDVVLTTAVTPAMGEITVYVEVEPLVQLGSYLLQHVNDNRVTVTHPAALSGFAILIG